MYYVMTMVLYRGWQFLAAPRCVWLARALTALLALLIQLYVIAAVALVFTLEQPVPGVKLVFASGVADGRAVGYRLGALLAYGVLRALIVYGSPVVSSIFERKGGL